MNFLQFCNSKKVFYAIISFSLLLTSNVSFAEEDVSWSAVYGDGPLAGEEPSGGLEPQTNISLLAGFSGFESLCSGG